MKKVMTVAFALSALFAASGNPSEAASAAHSTCSELKLACLGSVDRGATASQRPVQFYKRQSSCRYLGGSTPAPESYCENLCNATWEQCIKTGFWEGRFLHRSAESVKS
jgi:hypothetical protein